MPQRLLNCFTLSENFLLLPIFGQFLGFGGVGYAWWYIDFQKLLHQFLLTLLIIHQCLLLSRNGNAVFLAFSAFFRKIEIIHFQKVYKGKIQFSSGSVLPLLRNLSSRFAAILAYSQFLSVNIILKLRNIISTLAVFQIAGFPILKKQKIKEERYRFHID